MSKPTRKNAKWRKATILVTMLSVTVACAEVRSEDIGTLLTSPEALGQPLDAIAVEPVLNANSEYSLSGNAESGNDWSSCAAAILVAPPLPPRTTEDTPLQDFQSHPVTICHEGQLAIAYNAHPRMRAPIFSMYHVSHRQALASGYESKDDNMDPDDVGGKKKNLMKSSFSASNEGVGFFSRSVDMLRSYASEWSSYLSQYFAGPSNNTRTGSSLARTLEPESDDGDNTETASHTNKHTKLKLMSGGKRPKFRKDPFLNTELQPNPTGEIAYEPNVWDKGHLAPNAFMRYVSDNSALTFVMTNAGSQAKWYNNDPWNKLEARIRRWIRWDKGPLSPERDLYLITGISYAKDRNFADMGATGNVARPDYYWTVLCDVSANESVGFVGYNVDTKKPDLGKCTKMDEFVTVKHIEENVYRYGSLFPSDRCNTAAVNPSHWWKDKVITC